MLIVGHRGYRHSPWDTCCRKGASEASQRAYLPLFYKPEAFKGDYKVVYVGRDIANDFIVGYGLITT